MIAGIPYPAITATGVWVAALAFLGILIRQIGPWRQQAHDAEVQFRDALLSRVAKLEAKIERQEARHSAEKALGNHKLRNITACFDAMLLMMELTPDRGPEVVAKIKEMRAAQIIAEAKEAAVIRAAEMEMGEEWDEEAAT